VLGIQWLKSLEPILCDFSALKMEFQKEGKKVLIRGMRVEKSEVDCSPTFFTRVEKS